MEEKMNPIQSLGLIGGKRASGILVKYSRHKDEDIRSTVASALGNLESDDVIRPLLKLALTALDERVRWDAIWSLGYIGKEHISPKLVGILNDNVNVRRAGARILGKISDMESVEKFSELGLKDDDSKVRTKVARALGKIGDKRVCGALIEALNDEDSDVRCAACDSLGELQC